MEDKIQILKLPEVIQMVRLKKSSIYRMVKDGKFPGPVKLASRSRGWVESEVQDYLREKISERGINYA